MTKTEYSLSVIVPVFNAEDYLGQCLDSLLVLGAEDDIEVVCVDDGSTDGSWILLCSYAESHGNVTIVHQENAGVSEARNHGIRMASGEHIMFVDSDDWLSDGWWSVLAPLLRQDYDCVAFGFYEETGSESKVMGKPFGSLRKGDSTDFVRAMLLFDTPYGGYTFGKVVRTKIIIQGNDLLHSFEADCSLHEDEWFWLHVAGSCRSVAFASDALYHYRYVASSLSHAYSRNRNMHEIAGKERTLLFVRVNYSECASLARSRVVLAIGGFIRRYYVLGDSGGLSQLRMMWRRYPGRSIAFSSDIPFSLRAGAILCDVAMLLRVSPRFLSPFRKVLSRGMPDSVVKG